MEKAVVYIYGDREHFYDESPILQVSTRLGQLLGGGDKSPNMEDLEWNVNIPECPIIGLVIFEGKLEVRSEEEEDLFKQAKFKFDGYWRRLTVSELHRFVEGRTV